MKNLTYEAYCRNPALREQLEREARKLRDQEVNRLILAPLARWIKQAFTHSPIAATALRTGGMVGIVLLTGLLLSCESSGLSDMGITEAAPTRTATPTAAVTAALLERFDHSVVNQSGTAHDSDLPGVSIAAYGL